MTTATGPFTELSVRRLGPVRRFFVRCPAAMDTVVVVLFVLAVATSALDPLQARDLPATLAFAAAGGTALVFRRSRPLPVTAAMGALAFAAAAFTGQLGGMDLGLGFALYAVAVAYPPRTTWITATATTLTSTLAVWLWEVPTPDPRATTDAGTMVLTDDRWASVVGLLLGTLAALSIGISVRNRRQHLVDLVARDNALTRDRDRQAQLARAAERSRIAREMHDVVAHSVSVMITLADGATAALDRAPDQSRIALAELASTGRAALGDMRRVLGALADGATPWEPAGEGQDLAALVERFRAAGLPVRAEGVEQPMPDETGLRLAVYRVTQEALTNVLRHAPGTGVVDLRVRHDPDRWVVDVADDGAGTTVVEAGGAGMGLIGMRERVALLGGTAEAGPSDGGWRVHVELPTTQGARA